MSHVNRPLSDDFKEQVRSRIDLLALVSETVALRPQRGGRDYVGLCPFHDDRNPSMHVYTDRQSFRCWVCNLGGDCFAFVMQRDRVGFREALELLAQKAGLEMPRHMSRGEAGQDRDARMRHYELVAWAEREFHQCLIDDPIALRARKYLRDRGISDESMVRFRLGFHPDDWDWLQNRARGKYRPEELAAVKLVREREGRGGFYDCFVDRVLFPIRDPQRRPIAFGGRILPDSRNQQGAKYLNSDEYPLFQKSKLLYGLDEAREWVAKGDLAVVTEGYTDCIVAHQHGLKNVVCTLGTALNESHVTLLRRFARRVVLVFDGDKAGQDATERSLPKFLAQEVDLRTLTLPGGQDPADYLNEHGPEPFRELLRGAREAWEFKYRRVMERYGVDSIDSRHRVLQEMLEILAEVPVAPGGSLAGKWAEREQIILGGLAQRLKLSEGFIRQRLDEARHNRQLRGGGPRVLPLMGTAGASGAGAGGVGNPFGGEAGGGGAGVGGAAGAGPTVTWPALPRNPSRDERAELDLLIALFAHPESAARAAESLAPANLSHASLRRLYELCLIEHAQGRPTSFERLSLVIDDSVLLRLAVEVDELARATQPMEELLDHSLLYFHRRQQLEFQAVQAEAELAEEREASEPELGSSLTDAAREKLRRAMGYHRTRMSHTTGTTLTPPPSSNPGPRPTTGESPRAST